MDNGWKASATTCLIEDGNTKIITDPGCNRHALLEALEKENLKTSNINYVFWTHRHPDHILLSGIFENAKHITFDAGLMYDGDTILSFDEKILGENIQILDTPGHTNEHISLLVKTEIGNITIAGDVIWWLDDEPQVFDLHQQDHAQAIDLNMEQLVKSREKILNLSDYVIPGHGKMFKVDKAK